MEYINILINKKTYDLQTKGGYCVRIDKAKLERLIETATVLVTHEFREDMLADIRKSITQAGSYIDKNPSKVGNCQEWEDLVDDCVYLVILEFVQHGNPIDVVTDDVFESSIWDIKAAVDPILYSIAKSTGKK